MLSTRTSEEEEISCPQCTNIYSFPVLLECGHNICKLCLQNFWEWKKSKECPVCGCESFCGTPPINQDLTIAVEQFQKRKAMAQEICQIHNEKLKIFCNSDEVPICLVCQLSKDHRMHKCSPVEEAAQQKKAEMTAILESLRKKVRTMSKTKHQWEETKAYLETQGEQIELAVKEEFLQLHQFLKEEEERRLRDLREEKGKKIQVMYSKIEDIEEDIKTLNSTISKLDIVLRAKDLPFLKEYKETKQRVRRNIQEPESIRGILIDSAKHLGILKFAVCKKMLSTVKYSSVILDPNTAHYNLKLSEELTRLQYSNKQNLPDNPERCTSRMCVLGASGFTSGKHSWTIEVGQSKDWYIGVARESIKRKSTTFMSPEEGYWVIGQCSKDSIWVQTSPRSRVSVKQVPKKITVQVDYEKGKVAFVNAADSAVMHKFKEKFSEKIYPYFSVGLCEEWKNSIPLTICPVSMKVVPENA
ncbi:E3 ubiquitin-protein ligase TRIM39-like [Cyprinodon tularosa]|uniref:E3 ubiquitin-protein ligase TRIM39-like n=1 Tax=Cyprinodon tularosa TaxID=77115 RepID=UPI0018E25B18|nr:E3 ubiquitin-protein ligase TRIM39-like [Cyprinodon tularosa]